MADDLLQGLRDAVAEQGENPEYDGKASIEELLKALEDMPGVSDEDKKNMLKNLAGGLFGNKAGSQLPIGSVISNPWLEFGVLFGLITLIVLALALIGYKLYNSMIGRERRRELKKLQKGQKKKK